MSLSVPHSLFHLTFFHHRKKKAASEVVGGCDSFTFPMNYDLYLPDLRNCNTLDSYAFQTQWKLEGTFVFHHLKFILKFSENLINWFVVEINAPLTIRAHFLTINRI